MNGLRFKIGYSENMKKYDFFAYKDNFATHKLVRSNLVFGNLSMSKPLVSITIPTFKRPELLKEAVESVLKQRDFSDFEIVIVDNDSERLYSDKIIRFLSELNDERIRYYINEQNVGVFGNWNRCIELASGTWMTVLSDDDLLFKNYLSTLTNEIIQDSTLNRVECRYQIFSDSSNIAASKKQLKQYNRTKKFLGGECYVSYKMYLFDCFTAPHTQLYKRDLAYEIGGFDPAFAPISDYVFNAKYLYLYPGGVFLNQYLCGYRWAVNASQQMNVKVGICLWNRAFRKYLLNKNASFINKFVVYSMNYLDLGLLGKNDKLVRRLFAALIWRSIALLKRFLRVPGQIG